MIAAAVLSLLLGFGASGVGEPPALLVVAPRAFHEALGPYLAFRAEQRPTRLVALEDVLATSEGRDDPERLKRRLYGAWREEGVRYVLLVGDAHLVPVRYMVLDRVTPAAYDYAFYPSDLYYGDVARRDGTFDDWNARTEGFHAGYFGEVRGEKNKDDPINYDAVDYRPELAVGRWPVSSVEDVARVAAKTIGYERSLDRPDRPGSRRAAYVAVPGWVDTRGRMDGWAANLPGGWSAARLYDDHGAEAVCRALDEGVALVVHAGHGQDDRWEGSLGVERITSLRNADRLPVMVSAGCSTARFATLPPYEAYEDVNGQEHVGTNAGEVFDAPPPPPSPYARGPYNKTGLGERLVVESEAGAVAYIGCNTGSQPCGLTLLDGFHSALSRLAEPTLGDCWVGAIEHYHDAEQLATIVPNDDWYPASVFFQGMKFLVFGDPALRLPKPAR